MFKDKKGYNWIKEKVLLILINLSTFMITYLKNRYGMLQRGQDFMAPSFDRTLDILILFNYPSPARGLARILKRSSFN